MKEIWKDIPEYEELYQISNLGGVRSKDRLILEWCTAKENINHGTCIQRRVEKQKITNRRRKPVISIDESGNEKEYLSAWDASRKIGAFQSNIWKAIHNGKKCNGYYWKYKEE